MPVSSTNTVNQERTNLGPHVIVFREDEADLEL